MYAFIIERKWIDGELEDQTFRNHEQTLGNE